MPITDATRYLAENCYGYGRWSACYWFIGPEQGMGDETVEDRARAFREADLDEDGLCDCREFHLKINDARWHVPQVKFQSTWNYQISLLHGYKGMPSTPDARRNYQIEELGRADGETCITELRGLSSRNSSGSLNQDQYIPFRIRKLRKMIELQCPVFVIFYGTGDQDHWESISECTLHLDKITSHAGTMFAYLPHTNARKGLKRRHADWIHIGEQLRAERERLGLPDRCIPAADTHSNFRHTERQN